AERDDVRCGAGRRAGAVLLLQMLEHHDRRLARESRGSTGDVFVQHEIAHDQDAVPGQSAHLVGDRHRTRIQASSPPTRSPISRRVLRSRRNGVSRVTASSGRPCDSTDRPMMPIAYPTKTHATAIGPSSRTRLRLAPTETASPTAKPTTIQARIGKNPPIKLAITVPIAPTTTPKPIDLASSTGLSISAKRFTWAQVGQRAPTGVGIWQRGQIGVSQRPQRS